MLSFKEYCALEEGLISYAANKVKSKVQSTAHHLNPVNHVKNAVSDIKSTVTRPLHQIRAGAKKLNPYTNAKRIVNKAKRVLTPSVKLKIKNQTIKNVIKLHKDVSRFDAKRQREKLKRERIKKQMQKKAIV